MENFEELAKNGSWENIQKLLLQYATSTDLETQRAISKALYQVDNRKQLIAAIFEVEKSLSDLQQQEILLCCDKDAHIVGRRRIVDCRCRLRRYTYHKPWSSFLCTEHKWS